jgi:hypothetical protein
MGQRMNMTWSYVGQIEARRRRERKARNCLTEEASFRCKLEPNMVPFHFEYGLCACSLPSKVGEAAETKQMIWRLLETNIDP